MKKILLTLIALFGLVANSFASEAFLVTVEIIQDNQVIGTPKLLLPEDEEGKMELIGDDKQPLYSIMASVKNIEENQILIKTKLMLPTNGVLVTVGEPQFVIKRGEPGSVVIPHHVFGEVELKIKVNVQNHG